MERKGQKLKEEMQQELQKTTAMLKEEMERKGQKLQEEAQQELQRAQNKTYAIIAFFVLLVAIVFSGKLGGVALQYELKRSTKELEAQIDLLKMKLEQSLPKIDGVTLKHELKQSIEALKAQIDLLKQELTSSSSTSTEITKQYVESKQQREDDITRTAGFRSTTNERVQRLQDELTQAAKSHEKASETIQQMKAELRGYGEELARLTQQVDALNKRGWFSK